MNFTLQIGEGDEQSPSALGIGAATLIEDVSGGSQLQLGTSQSITEASIIAPFERVILRESGTIRFIGWLDQAPRSATGQNHQSSYTLTGPHRWLDRATFAQTLAGLALIGGTAGAAANQTPKALSVVLPEILDAALAAYPGKFIYTGANTWTHEIPVERRLDSTCLQALRAAMGYAPAGAMWWTYGIPGDETKPVLNIAAASSTADATLSTETHDIDAAKLTPRYDLLADTISAVFIKDGAIASTDTVGPGGEAFALSASKTLTFTFDTGTLYSVPAHGIAAALADWYQRLHIDGQASKLSLDWTDRPGQVIGFAGSLAAFSARKTLLHTVTRDLFAEKTTLTLGVIPGKNVYPVSQRSDENNGSGGGGGGGGTPETGTLNVNIAGGDMPDGLATWSAGKYGGSGTDSITVEPGSYTVIAYPVYDPDTGFFWLPEAPQTASVSASGSDSVTITYTQLSRLRLKAGTGTTPEIDINIDDLAGLTTDTVAKLRAVERCDGQQSIVIKTDWVDPT